MPFFNSCILNYFSYVNININHGGFPVSELEVFTFTLSCLVFTCLNEMFNPCCMGWRNTPKPD